MDRNEHNANGSHALRGEFVRSIRGWLFLAFLVVLPVSLIRAPASNFDLFLHHCPTACVIYWLWSERKQRPFSDVGYLLTFLFLLLHTLGARYLYSEVPYDVWIESVIGVHLGEAFGFSRNHYDRFVHFAFGLLIYVPARQLIAHRTNCSHGVSCVLAVGLLVALGTIYELLEWLISVTMTPGAAENYNGQQGDVWDPQKDMALALLGALFAVGVETVWRMIRRRRRSDTNVSPS